MESQEFEKSKALIIVEIIEYVDDSVVIKPIKKILAIIARMGGFDEF